MAKVGNPNMALIARLGGLAISRDRAHMAAIGRRGGLTHSIEHMTLIARMKRPKKDLNPRSVPADTTRVDSDAGASGISGGTLP